MKHATFLRSDLTLANDRISVEDSTRQERAVEEILERLERQPGLILADEVGMGKTFVALAVAASILVERGRSRPVVVMVPPSLKEKWPKDWEVFKEKCLISTRARRLIAESAATGIEFLKLLDDAPATRAQIIFLTHGALNRAATDPWVRLAVIKRAFKGRGSLQAQRRAFPRFASRLLWLDWVEKRSHGILGGLMQSPPDTWMQKLHDAHPYFIDRIQDDPVPTHLWDALVEMPREAFDPLVEALKDVPLRESAYIEERLADTRSALVEIMNLVWRDALRRARFTSPLLILDEAHHVKNPKTALASLFVDEEAAKDSAFFQTGGALGGKFERMLFLTATPFQLGHTELARVLERFEGISWQCTRKPEIGRKDYGEEVRALGVALNDAQAAALRMDRAWGKLERELLVSAEGSTRSSEEWWAGVVENPQSEGERAAIEHVKATSAAMVVAEEKLRPWVLRHIKHDELSGKPGVPRRVTFPGAGIVDVGMCHDGIQIGPEVLLPFLLAGRARSLLMYSTRGRALFAEGLASSFEAYVETRSGKVILDDDIDATEQPMSRELGWYLKHIDAALPRDGSGAWAAHPKIQATADRVVRLWRQGQKVLVFCHYRATGRSLRRHISDRIRREIISLGMQALPGLREEAVEQELERLGDQFFDSEGRIRRVVTEALGEVVAGFPAFDPAEREKIVEVTRRFLRTPSFLVRYFDLKAADRIQSFRDALARRDLSGLSLGDQIVAFCRFLEDCIPEERKRYLDALDRVQTGSHVEREVTSSLDRSEVEGEMASRLLPNVRLANGEVAQETRQRLLLTFNTPLFPEILIASSVLAEGVDLHRSCRHVIHHDLCWNPSTLEQRNGRVDRIGSYSEQVGQSIELFLPYVAATQDEKMYRVVKDRERWFQIVMGEKYEVDELETERRAERIPLPRQLQHSLSLHLGVDRRES